MQCADLCWCVIGYSVIHNATNAAEHRQNKQPMDCESQLA